MVEVGWRSPDALTWFDQLGDVRNRTMHPTKEALSGRVVSTEDLQFLMHISEGIGVLERNLGGPPNTYEATGVKRVNEFPPVVLAPPVHVSGSSCSSSCYDTLFARLLDECGVDLLLVGDSVAEVLNGAGSTLAATLDQMIYHATAVCRGVRRALVVCDLPFLSYHVSVPSAIANAGRVMQETGCAAVKLEDGRERVETIRYLVEAGIPVMGHLGLTPQSIHIFGGHRVQGRDEAAAQRLEEDGQWLQEAGAFALVLELVPAPLATRIASQLEIPVIGIGAGSGCDGQVLVLHDLLGLTESFRARFVKRYAALSDDVRDAVRQYAAEVRDGSFPAAEHSFSE